MSFLVLLIRSVDSKCLFVLLLGGAASGFMVFFRKRTGYYLALLLCGAALVFALAQAAHLNFANLDQDFKTLWFGKKKVFWIGSSTLAAVFLFYLLTSKRVRAVYFRPRA